MPKIKRAILSVYHKEGIVPFARFLTEKGVEVISTGGTFALLKKEGVPAKEVSQVTGFPEMLDGRVKTLHPNLHAGLLAIRGNAAHEKSLEEYGIRPIDLLVVNLYPFAETVRSKAPQEEIIEMIDIGGPAMLRSAAKNFKYVAAVSDPADYEMVLKELREKDMTLTEPTRRLLAAKVFRLTALYDGMVRDFFSGNASRESGGFPAALSLQFQKEADLRYGENPHQKGALYKTSSGQAPGGVIGAKKLNGKELSFNNILDLDAALEMVSAFTEPACAIIKHTGPCGFSVAKNSLVAFKNALACDPVSAFGSIIGFNHTVDLKTARAILDSGFVECVIARQFEKDALELLKTKKNLRLLSVAAGWAGEEWDFKKVRGGVLLQDRDTKGVSLADLKCVTKTKPSRADMEDLLFAFKVCGYVKSNAIVVATKGMTLGLGMGQPSRVDSCRAALTKAGKRSKGAVLASDGFFPKPDSIVLAKKYGIRAIVQPGGSIQDEVVIEAANRAKISMVFTGIRHFRH
ncbi:MAG: bifunctional phosphoribosylaminoimidazolecarboxamide formyltransferase/IMP cyclohydrolase [Candidatus Omnitrophica bacterium]|nr:bifunctional phosphoribosylaminoimidazolecarboxamide formyltransferase/IMP cyclohydrolase [Candidatus Omnitrophota bacterium]